jgi:zinc protease
VRVLVKPTDFKEDEVRMSAYSPGGTSLVSDADFMSAAYASTVLSEMGWGKFSKIDLSKKLSGKVASVGRPSARRRKACRAGRHRRIWKRSSS